MAYYMFSPLDVGGWICLQSMACIRLLGGGLNAGRMEGGMGKVLASIRGHGIVSVDSSTVEAKKGEK
jgi:hypothetical protein